MAQHIIPIHRFDPRCYVPPDEIPRVRHSLIPRIKPAWHRQTPLSGENEKRSTNVSGITRAWKTAGTKRAAKIIIIMRFYAGKYHGNNRRNMQSNVKISRCIFRSSAVNVFLKTYEYKNASNERVAR